MEAKILEKINDYSKEYGDYRYRQGVLVVSDIMVLIVGFIISVSAIGSSLYLGQEKLTSLIILILVCVTVFIALGNYKTLWNTSVDKEIMMILISVLISTSICFIVDGIMGYIYPITFYIITALINHVGMCTIRILYRTMRKAVLYFRVNQNVEKSTKVLIIGAGSAGKLILREMFENPQLNMCPVGIIDDNINKLGKTYYNVAVVGTTDEIEQIAKNLNIDEIIFTIAKIDNVRKREIIQICKKTKCKVKTIPGICELIDGRVSIKSIRDVNIEDLLGRESIKIKDPEVVNFIKNKKVLVTGAGGSIGSELSRQIGNLNPKELILVGFTALSVDINTNLSTLYLAEIFAVFNVPNTLFFIASQGLSSISGTCL